MSRRRSKKKKRPSSSPGGVGRPSISMLKALMSGNPMLAQMLAEDMGVNLADMDDFGGVAAAPAGVHPEVNLSPAETHRYLSSAASSARETHGAAVRQKAQQIHDVYSIEEFEPTSYIEALVGTNVSNQRRVLFTFNFSRRSFSLECSCGKQPCVHTFQLTKIVLDQLDDEDSVLFRGIFGDDYAEQKRLQQQQQEERERNQKQQKLLSMLQRARSTAVVNTVGLDELQIVEPERVLWNLNVTVEFNTPHLELKAIRQKETKSGTWSKGREVSLKSFMGMPREGWSKIDWAIAEKTESLNWNPHFRISNDDAFRILEGTEMFQLNRQPATLEVVPFELVVKDVDAGWVLTTSARVVERAWDDDDDGGDSISIGAHEGNLVVSNKLSKVAWIRTPEDLRDLVRFVTMETAFFPVEQRDVLLAQLNELQGKVPLQLPPSLGGEVFSEETESLLLLRMKQSGVLEATVCVRDSRGLSLLPGDGLLRRQATVDGASVQYVRDSAVERDRARDAIQRLSLGQHRRVRDWTWRIEGPDAVVDLLSAAGELVSENVLKMVWHQSSARQFNIIGKVSAANVSVKVSRQRDWFGVDGTARIGDQDVALKDLLAGLRGASRMDGFVEVSPGQWAAIADEFRATLQQLADVANDNRGKLQLDASAAMSLSAIEDNALKIEADRAWEKCLSKVRSIKTINPDPPASLNCELREYQVEGFRWMCRLSEWGVGGILADDMGLGKTVQTLAVLLQRMETGPALVIAPTSLGFNWEQECHRFAPSLTPKLLREADRDDLIKNATEGDVIICSYGLALRETELLQSVNWGTLILDEAQNIKNSNAKTSKEIRRINADWKVALTGTPMENHLGELWSIFRAVSPGVLGPWEQFRKKFAGPIEKENDNERRQALSRVISPFILRRSKKEVLTDLPERSESNLLIELTPEERERYDQVRLAAVGELDSLGDTELSGDQRFKVLQLLTRLRQISCHVGLVDDKWDKGSSKLTMLMERMEQLKERGNRPLIFSQFTSHLALIREACDAAKISYQYLDGQTTPKARQQRVEAFQDGEGDAFLISLKAGGTGLNLTAADYVIHMDPWWNPAVEDQATDRAHRIGQQKSVMVYRIIAKGTIEEQILSLHEEKRDLVEGVLSGAEASAKLTTEQLAKLIRTGVAV